MGGAMKIVQWIQGTQGGVYDYEPVSKKEVGKFGASQFYQGWQSMVLKCNKILKVNQTQRLRDEAWQFHTYLPGVAQQEHENYSDEGPRDALEKGCTRESNAIKYYLLLSTDVPAYSDTLGTRAKVSL